MNNFHQKTALADGFNASVGSKPTLAPQVKVNVLYYKMAYLSKVTKQCLRGPDGIRPRTFYLGGNWSTINLPAQITEAGVLLQDIIRLSNQPDSITSLRGANKMSDEAILIGLLPELDCFAAPSLIRLGSQ